MSSLAGALARTRAPRPLVRAVHSLIRARSVTMLVVLSTVVALAHVGLVASSSGTAGPATGSASPRSPSGSPQSAGRAIVGGPSATAAGRSDESGAASTSSPASPSAQGSGGPSVPGSFDGGTVGPGETSSPFDGSPSPLVSGDPGPDRPSRTNGLPWQSSTPTPAGTPTPAPTATSTPTPRPAASTVRWAIIGNDGTHLSPERSAGLTTKVFELGWSSYETANGVFSGGYIAAKRSEAAALRAAGFTLILSLGVQYTPAWMMSLPNAYYVDQYGTRYDDASSGSGRANLIWNEELRALEARYIARVFADLGTDWAAVRIGGGRYGELGYPVASYGTETNTYWAFDANAARSDPVPGWKPGMASPNGEAGRFAAWYLDRLAGYATWQASTVRSHFAGRLMVLFPSFGIRPGQLAAAVAANLSGATSPERNGEVPRGYDYARQVKALSAFSGIVLASTWLDCPYGNDASASPVDWRPIHYLTYLAAPYGMARYGENTGQGSASVLEFTAAQARTYGLLGFAWFNEREVYAGSYATISDIARIVAAG
ncbi:MAG TPA: hypothetical protein VEY67_05760 [Candidatus Dormibacteraeota bacterium]|nr:hypothetical protein [Candidatus Dormibacteraeota bacterium]